MNPVSSRADSCLAYKDAIFLSGHKFLGGPGATLLTAIIIPLFIFFGSGCPGVLVAKRRLLSSGTRPPVAPGGGTVFFVTEDHHR